MAACSESLNRTTISRYFCNKPVCCESLNQTNISRLFAIKPNQIHGAHLALLSENCIIVHMRNLVELMIHIIITLLRLFKPGGTKSVMAENITLRQKLIVLKRSHKCTPPLTTHDQFLFGLLSHFITVSRLHKIAIMVKPATILRFHRALVKRKYQRLYSNKGIKKSGRNGPSQIDCLPLAVSV